MASSSSSIVLLGPPEIRNLSNEFLSIAETNSDGQPSSESLPFADMAMCGSVCDLSPFPDWTEETPEQRFVELLTSQFHSVMVPQPLYNMCLTENFSPTFVSTGNPCLDFFFHVVPYTSAERLTELLESSWKFDATTTLKLIYHLRGVRGKGKSDREGFYTAALWLHENHPKSLACNLNSFFKAGYLKDLPEILFRLMEGRDVREIQKMKRIKRMFWERKCLKKERKVQKGDVKTRPREERVAEEMERNIIRVEKAAQLRRAKTANMALKVIERYDNDQNFKFLYDEISKLFAGLLISDLAKLNSGKTHDHLSLAAKWCPSLDNSFDRSLLLCESIAKRVFPRESHPEYAELEEAHYSYRVRDRLRKQVLVPLKKILELPEVYMSANQWDLLPYDRVASIAMKNYKHLFKKHDGKRFNSFLNDVKQGKRKIASGALLPHEIVGAALEAGSRGEIDEVAELQWKGMVEEMKQKRSLSNALAVCDVSGSMMGIAMDVAIALGILVSELSSKPWHGHVITFSGNPQIHRIDGDTLAQKHRFVQQMNWGMNTNFQRMFDLILEIAVEGKLSQEDLIKRLFVFSDMEFDQASFTPWETDYMAIERKFKECGYQKPPEIVFWNLRDSQSTPVLGTQKGVALVSGFSKNLLKVFMEKDGEIDPLSVMEDALSGTEYEHLVVMD